MARRHAVGLALAGSLCLGATIEAEPMELSMAGSEKLAREWVEVSEESGDGRIVLRPVDYPIPPTRGARRHLQLARSGSARSLGTGPADALEQKGSGDWSVEGDTLQLDLSGWKGEYQIEKLGGDILVLRRR